MYVDQPLSLYRTLRKQDVISLLVVVSHRVRGRMFDRDLLRYAFGTVVLLHGWFLKTACVSARTLHALFRYCRSRAMTYTW